MVYQRDQWFATRRAALVAIFCGALIVSAGVCSAETRCGDGVLDTGETCDDHNTRNDDCCSSSCELIECTVLSENPVVWEEMGPFSIGGRVTALAIDPQDPLHAVVGSPAGGVWQSVDGGATWQTLASWLAVTPISALAIHPSDPEVIVAGTGSVTDGGSVRSGIGIIRSPDGGSNWSQVTQGQIVPYVAALLFWMEEPQRVVAAADLGVLLSLDGGLSFDFSLQGKAISALVRDPFDPDTIFASSRTGLFLSVDRGQSWSQISSWPLLETDIQGAGTTALAVSHQTPGVLYATVQVLAAFNQTDRALFLKSTDGGLTFQELAAPGPFCAAPDSCGYGQALVVHPDDDQRLLLGGDVLLSSFDGGANWNELGTAAVKVHEIALHSQGAYVANASGMAVVDNAWSDVTSRNDGLAITSVVSLDVSDEVPPRLLAGTADAGTMLGVGEQPSWTVIFGENEPSGTARFDPFDGDRFYVAKPHAGFFRSDDAGESFTSLQEGLDLGQASSAVTPFEPSTLVPDMLFTGLMQPFQSTDAGDSWQVFRPPGFPEISKIAVSPFDSNRVYFALSSGGALFKADDINTEFLEITSEPNHRVTSIFLDPGAENIVFTALANTASQTGKVFKSWNFGADWQDITPFRLPTTTSIVRDRFGALYVGNTEGVWRSANDGSSWARFQSGLQGSAVDSLRLSEERLFAATAGRGVFSIPLLELTSIESIPDGQLFWVDGVLVRTPYFALWEPGSVHTVEPYLLQTVDSRQIFESWSDGSDLANEMVVGEGNSATIAAIRNLYRLELSGTPAAGGSVAVEPPTADQFFVENSVVSWVAVPASDHRFVAFSGDLSGSQNNFGFAVMDRPRSVVADFEQLFQTIDTDPPGLTVTVDGNRTNTPQMYHWSVDSFHWLSADAIIDLDPGDPAKLVFDGWNDLFGREHGIFVRRDGFVHNLKARYITVVPELEAPSRTTQVVRTEGHRVASRIASLNIEAEDGGALASLQFIRGVIEDQLIIELALMPSEQRLEIHSFIQGGSATGKTRIVLCNPGPEEAVVDLLLRDENGNGLVARPDALRIAPGGRTVGFLEELIALDDPYQGMLSIFSDQPIVASVQSVRFNLRPSTFLDPILVIPSLGADRGVPRDPIFQALLLTDDTEHQLVLSNPGLAALAGSLLIWDEEGQPLALADDFPFNPSYNIPSGGYEVFRFRLADSGGSGVSVPETGRVRLVPSFGQDVPLVQLVEEQVVGQSSTGPIILPRSIPPSRRVTTFAVPVDLSRRDSGAILTNPAIFSSAEVEVSLHDLDGNETAAVTVSVPAKRQVLALATELFPSVPESFQGVLRGSSTTELDVVGILRQVNDRSEQLLAGFAVLEASPDDPPDGEFTIFPFAIDGDSWSSEWWHVNSSFTRSTVVTFSFTGEWGETLNLPMEW